MAVRRIRPGLYTSVGTEADGPVPGPYSMLSLSAAVAGRQDADGFTPADPQERTFYCELRPVSAEFVPQALAVSGLDRERQGEPGCASHFGQACCSTSSASDRSVGEGCRRSGRGAPAGGRRRRRGPRTAA